MSELVPGDEAVDDEVLTEVRTALSAAGLRVPELELDSIALSWVRQRVGIESLYAVPAARYIDPALRFYADPQPPRQPE